MDAGRRWGLRKTDYLFLAATAVVLAARFAMAHRYIHGFDCYVYFSGVRSFLAGHNPYASDSFVTPPSGIVPLLWMRLASFGVVYWIMMAIQAVAVVTGVFFCLRRLTSLRPPVALATSFAVAAIPMPTYTTIGFGSLNGLIFMTFVFALIARLDGDDRNAGIWLGVGLALKPVLFPFWLLFLAQRKWGAALWTVVPVAVGSLVALVINPDVIHFVDQGLPNAVTGLQNKFTHFNISVTAFAKTVGFSQAIGTLGRAVALVLTAAAAYLLWRWYQQRGADDALAWLDIGSVLTAGTFLASTFAWRYYVIFLIPLFVRALRRSAIVFHPVLWVGALLATVPDGLGFVDPKGTMHKLEAARYTGGVTLVIVGVGLAVLLRSRQPRPSELPAVTP